MRIRRPRKGVPPPLPPPRRFPGGRRPDGSAFSFVLHTASAGGRLPFRWRIAAAGGLVWVDDCLAMIRRERGWDVPGGHVEQGEHPEEALVRQVMEQARLRVVSRKMIAALESDRDALRSWLIVYHAVAERLEWVTPTCDLVTPAEALHRYSAGDRDLFRELLALSQGAKERRPT